MCVTIHDPRSLLLQFLPCMPPSMRASFHVCLLPCVPPSMHASFHVCHIDLFLQYSLEMDRKRRLRSTSADLPANKEACTSHPGHGSRGHGSSSHGSSSHDDGTSHHASGANFPGNSSRLPRTAICRTTNGARKR